MKLGHISRNYAKAFFAFVTIGMVSACADSTVAPASSEVAAFKAPAAFSIIGGVQTFRVRNSEGITQRIGGHLINIPANSICALNSSYGTTEWDKPCSLLQGDVVITATVLYDLENHPFIDFQPAMRFAPNKVVTLFLRNGRASQATQLNVNYCDNLGQCVDESLNDPSVKPFRVGATSLIGRRVKHFSGYYVAVGEKCRGTLTQEENGSWICDNEALTRRSGYMVASGKDGEYEDAKDEKKKDNQ